MKEKQIIEAARKLFHKFGFKKVSMDEIANAAGVTKKTIYMHFPSKEELLKYFIKEELTNMKNIVEEVEKKNSGFFETVNEGIYNLLIYKKEKDFLNIIAEEAEWLKNPVVIQNLQLIDEQIQNYIKQKLEEAKEKGYIYYEDVDVTSFLVYKMYMALIFDWDENNKKLDDKIIANTITNVLKNGLRKGGKEIE
ncbi:MAG: TetR/AcrR family transcriptional regulator [Clostridia bacterium]|nr:TetR/AcrR family transcriptional regulator [Clostridia bacterium]